MRVHVQRSGLKLGWSWVGGLESGSGSGLGLGCWVGVGCVYSASDFNLLMSLHSFTLVPAALILSWVSSWFSSSASKASPSISNCYQKIYSTCAQSPHIGRTAAAVVVPTYRNNVVASTLLTLGYAKVIFGYTVAHAFTRDHSVASDNG